MLHRCLAQRCCGVIWKFLFRLFRDNFTNKTFINMLYLKFYFKTFLASVPNPCTFQAWQWAYTVFNP